MQAAGATSNSNGTITNGRLLFSSAKPNAVARRPKPRAAPSPEPTPSSSEQENEDGDSTEDGNGDEDGEGEEDSDSSISSVDDADAFETDHADSEWEEEVLYGTYSQYQLEMWEAQAYAMGWCGPEKEEGEGDVVPTVAPATAVPAPVPVSAPTPVATPRPKRTRRIAQGLLDVDDEKWVLYLDRLQEEHGPLTTVKGTENRVHQILRYFDNMADYGPCIGATRRERWDRALNNGLNPPKEIDEILSTLEGRTDGKYVKPVFAAKITDVLDE